MKRKPIYLTNHYYKKILLTVFAVFFLLSVFWTVKELVDFNKRINNLRTEYIEGKKAGLKNEVEETIEYINFTHDYIHEKIKTEIKEKVYDSYHIANSFYERYKGKKTDNEIKSLIRETLRQMKFNDGRGYIFITDLNGVELLYPPHPEFEGENIIDYQDDKGNFPVKEEIELAKSKGEGFITGRWFKPGDLEDVLHEKLSYIKLFERYGWIIGSGEYTGYITTRIQNDIKFKLENYIASHEYDLFISTYAGKAIIINHPNYQEGESLLGMKDSSGFQIFKEELNALKSNKEAFLTYYWPNIKSSKNSEVISYIKNIPHLEWIIGVRTSVDFIKEQERILIEEHRTSLIKRILELFLGFLLSVIIIIIVTIQTKKDVNNEFNAYKSLLKSSIIGRKNILENELNYYEFKQLAITTNAIFKAARQAKTELEKSEELFKSILNYIPIMVFSMDAKGKTLLWNNECEKIFGISHDEAKSKKDIVSYIFSHAFLNNIRDYIEKSDGTFRLIQSKTTANEDRYQKWAFFRITSDQIIAVGYDVTDQIEREKQISDQQMFLKVLINNIPSPVFYKDIDLVYSGCNNKFCELYGLSESEIIGKTIFDIESRSVAEYFHKGDIKLIETGELQIYEAQIEDKNGIVHDFISYKNLFYDQNNDKAGIIGVMLEITDIKRYERDILENQDKLKELNATKDIFFSIIAHDLRNPFNALLGLTKQLFKNYEKYDVDDIKNYLHVIYNSADQTHKLLDNLLKWAATQTKTLKPNFQSINLLSLVNETINLLEETANQKNIRIINKIYEDYFAEIDYNMMFTITRNILSNAIKFTNNNGLIKVSATPYSEYIILCIADNGIGMDENQINALFDIAELQHTRGTNNEAGSGLGMVLCNELIKLNHGEITVNSEKNKGTEFSIRIPLVQNQ